MGFFSFGKKHQAAWNALMASYTFLNLPAPHQHRVLARAHSIAEDQMRTTLEDIKRNKGFVVFMNIFVYALGEEGIQPALGNEQWHWIKNPFIDCIGAEDVLSSQKQQIERKYGVSIQTEL